MHKKGIISVSQPGTLNHTLCFLTLHEDPAPSCTGTEPVWNHCGSGDTVRLRLPVNRARVRGRLVVRGICGLVGRVTTFVGGDVGSIPTCCVLEVWQWTFGSRTVWLINKSAGQPQFLVVGSLVLRHQVWGQLWARRLTAYI